MRLSLPLDIFICVRDSRIQTHKLFDYTCASLYLAIASSTSCSLGADRSKHYTLTRYNTKSVTQPKIIDHCDYPHRMRVRDWRSWQFCMCDLCEDIGINSISDWIGLGAWVLPWCLYMRHECVYRVCDRLVCLLVYFEPMAYMNVLWNTRKLYA